MFKSIGCLVSLVVGVIVVLFVIVIAVGMDDDGDGPVKSPPKKATSTGEKADPKNDSYGDGDYVVGKDIPAGTYETAGAENSFFDLCSITTDGKGPGGDGYGQVKASNKDERIIITLTPADGTLSISGCEPLIER